ncbi:probable F420-dependent oxidoreductase, Rv1855c family [Asanoa hainanensis]|uniref:Probable F420-dependent oxidoreductase, Rv1855c family n=1 Tax=Asanoa hainanensis TaxID=560556 RepID=A0A239PG82_9ACTN|nr:LLM class F420-dependent oxidoreductase [Asanoa hainanensis]SNT65992.1 probable F420-dependent oxidoreductase, Rv1855c family [Asanoa hainanensis]
MLAGVHFINFTLPGGAAAIAPTLTATARAAEDGSCATFTLMDHWFQMEHVADARDPMLEGYTALGFLAGRTSRINLGLMVTGVTYRHPGLLAKTVSTLDVLSGGRATLGLGAAWYEREHHAMGVPFPPVSERFERLEETLRICRQMWSPEDGPFEGKHYRLAETICEPQPVSEPRPRVLVGGMGEKKTLRLVAQYADACNLFAENHDQVAHKLRVLADHCAAVGRDPLEIQKTIIGHGDPINAPDQFLFDMEGYAKLGVELVEMVPRGSDPVGWTTTFCEKVVPRLAEIG